MGTVYRNTLNYKSVNVPVEYALWKACLVCSSRPLWSYYQPSPTPMIPVHHDARNKPSSSVLGRLCAVVRGRWLENYEYMIKLNAACNWHGENEVCFYPAYPEGGGSRQDKKVLS